MTKIAENQASLLGADGGPAQLSLLDVEPQFRDEFEKTGHFTGERLHAKDPGKYQAIVAAAAEKFSVRRIARAFKVSPGTIKAVCRREGVAIGALKKEIAGKLKDFVEGSVDRLLEEGDEIDIDKLPLATAIAIDKMQLLDGEATEIVEHQHRVTMDQYNDLVTKIGQSSETGPTAQENFTKGLEPGAVVDAELIEDQGSDKSLAVGFKPDAKPPR